MDIESENKTFSHGKKKTSNDKSMEDNHSNGESKTGKSLRWDMLSMIEELEANNLEVPKFRTSLPFLSSSPEFRNPEVPKFPAASLSSSLELRNPKVSKVLNALTAFVTCAPSFVELQGCI